MKAKNFGNGHLLTTDQLRGNFLASYLAERDSYRRLQGSGFNSVFLADQPDIFGWFEVDGKCHSMGPTTVLEFITGKLEKFPVGDKEKYQLAKTQLDILHTEGITHNDIDRRNIISTKDNVILIDLGLSSCKDEEGVEVTDFIREDMASLKIAFGFSVEVILPFVRYSCLPYFDISIVEEAETLISCQKFFLLLLSKVYKADR